MKINDGCPFRLTHFKDIRYLFLPGASVNEIWSIVTNYYTTYLMAIFISYIDKNSPRNMKIIYNNLHCEPLVNVLFMVYLDIQE